MKNSMAILFLVAALGFWPRESMSAEIIMLGNPGIKDVMAVLSPDFERINGKTVKPKYGLFIQLKPIIDANDFDVIVTTGEVADYVVAQAKINGELIDVAQVGIGVAIKTGAAKPDISTTEFFKQTLLRAKSISYTSGSTAGDYLAKLMERLGIADQVKRKVKLLGGGGQNPKAVADGDVELGISLISDIKPYIGKGVDLLGPLPPELQYYIVERAGVSKKAKDPQAAKELIDFLRSATGQTAFRDQGLEPIP